MLTRVVLLQCPKPPCSTKTFLKATPQVGSKLTSVVRWWLEKATNGEEEARENGEGIDRWKEENGGCGN
ncbi:uncharacterized protein G2W53_020964 [Senna tora]|uniref:Uncharacterized protein n=1 Tax=Senna tora TaxID=362788 RepID=A0A834TL32_9FABA|nr:uncharacterized protein G2W53_020964 [Senna tora]